jgi:hypothetical protein
MRLVGTVESIPEVTVSASPYRVTLALDGFGVTLTGWQVEALIGLLSQASRQAEAPAALLPNR